MPKKRNKKYVVEYSSNNSGGRWWLKDAEWKALEKDGWAIRWAKTDPIYLEHGHLDSKKRYMGALAKEASLEVEAPNEDIATQIAVDSFENVTHQTASDEGCNCCGPPHYFSAREAKK